MRKMPCPENDRGPSLAQRVGSTLFFVAIASVVVWIIGGLFKIIVTPITWLWASDDELGGRKGPADAITARTTQRTVYAEDTQDPMYQYISRFVEHPLDHLGDPDNDYYQKWYEQFGRGEILDSDLRWAPEVYDDDHKICNEFLRYLEVQVNLHEGRSEAGRFLKTIRKYYPEFEAKFSSIKLAIEGLRRRNVKAAQRAAIKEELAQAGIPAGIAVTLSLFKMSSEELRERLLLVRKRISQGYPERVVEVMAVHGIRDEFVVEQGNILYSNGIDPTLAVDISNGDLTQSDIRDVLGFASNFRNVMGDAAFAPSMEDHSKTLIEAAVEQEIEKVRKAHRRNVRNAMWRQS